jgi:hypothetical protein
MRAPDEQRTDPSDPETESASNYLLWLPSILAILIVLYALSVGPAVRLCNVFTGTYPIIAAIYSPIFRTCEHYDVSRRALYWYLTVWGVDMQRYQ